MFKISRLSDFGADTPAVARLGPGVHELIQFSRLSAEDRERVFACTMEVMQLLVPAQRLAKEVIAEFDSIEAGLRQNDVVFEAGRRVIEVPSSMKLDKVADFIVRAKKVLARAIELVELFWGKKFSAAHYHRALEWARSALGEGARLTRLLADDQKWIKHIIDLRNEEEHPSGKGPFIRNYDVNVLPDGRVEVVPPRFFDGTNVRSALSIYSEDLLTFTEELVVIGVADTFLMPHLAIAEIPAHERDPGLPVRFKIVLNDEMARKLSGAIREGGTPEESPPPNLRTSPDEEPNQ